MRIVKIVFLTILAAGVSVDGLLAHGVSATVGRGGVVIRASYDSGDPMSYAKVTIRSPGHPQPFQSGGTDRNGRFCFFPDAAGPWQVVITDGMGHRLDRKVVVDAAFRLSQGYIVGQEKTLLRRLEKALSGLFVLLGMSGLVYGWRARRPANDHDTQIKSRT